MTSKEAIDKVINMKGFGALVKHLVFLQECGHGEVTAKVADGAIVHTESRATQDLTKKNTEGS